MAVLLIKMRGMKRYSKVKEVAREGRKAYMSSGIRASSSSRGAPKFLPAH